MSIAKPSILGGNVFDAVAVPLAIVGEDTLLLRVNSAFLCLFGATADEMEERKLVDLIAESDRAAVLEYYRLVDHEQNPWATPLHFPILCRGKKRYVSGSFSLLPETSCCVLTLVDETAWKYSQYKLKQNLREMQMQHQDLCHTFKIVEYVKREWEKIVDCVDDMVIFTDADGYIKRCNQSLKNQLGASYQDILGKSFANLMKDFEVGGGDNIFGGVELYHPKTCRWYTINTYPFVPEGGATPGTVITVHDVTQLKQLNRELELINRQVESKSVELEKAYQELKSTQSKVLHHEKMASVGQLAAGVAHEINNPMGFISSNLSTLEKYIEKLMAYVQEQEQAVAAEGLSRLAQRRKELKIDHVCADIIELIHESLDGADRVKTIVQNLKSFSRVDNVELSSADINACLKSTISMVSNEIKYKGTLESDFGHLPLLRCFPQQLNQVFMNLLVNAAQAITEKGVVRVRTWCQGGFINVSIGDTGCGIAADTLGRIFEPFFTTKDVGQGTGLGLSISYDIVKKHGGEIIVDSDVGKGTTFTVHLPMNE
ncbi:PAS domain-containing sensor histidine kinase [Trichloromonas sp.]|uniref:PAS domain-containing sensor histidine kinase n=1 Tax=Trichloromonas sp. TaxID=3069249 RepID=UPI003D812F34